jgi:hypothetical protein
VTALSVVPVASKNTSNGEIPEARVTLALSVSGPLVPVHVAGGGGAPLLTDTVALCDTEPPLPVQVMVNVVVALSAPVDCEPSVPRAPDQPPEALQLVTLAEDQLSVELPPLDTPVGVALKDTVGADADTATVTDCVVEPPDPVQLIMKLVEAVSDPVDCDPLVPNAPDQPPEAVQPVELVDDQLSVEAPPLDTAVGFALNEAVGPGSDVVVLEFAVSGLLSPLSAHADNMQEDSSNAHAIAGGDRQMLFWDVAAVRVSEWIWRIACCINGCCCVMYPEMIRGTRQIRQLSPIPYKASRQLPIGTRFQ